MGIAVTVVKVRPDGPNVITGDVAVAGARPPATSRTTVVVCRCGTSRNKPYCDGTHTKIGFRDAGSLPIGTPAGTCTPSARVTLIVTPNGPLECRGPLIVEGADGRTACSENTRLCRCGHSQTKPFCDSSHEKVGFIG